MFGEYNKNTKVLFGFPRISLKTWLPHHQRMSISRHGELFANSAEEAQAVAVGINSPRQEPAVRCYVVHCK